MTEKKEKKLSVGAVIDRPGSTIDYKTGAWRAFKPIMIKEKCRKCGLCWASCPDSAVEKGKDGYFKINYDYCKGCGICATQCPFKAIEMKLEEK